MTDRLTTLHIQLLGRFHLTYKGQVVTTVNTHRLQALLGYLVLKAGVAQSRQHLSYLFWPDSTEAQARTNLRQLLHYFHTGLPDSQRFLEVDSQTLLWRGDGDFSLDVREFETAVSQAQQAETE